MMTTKESHQVLNSILEPFDYINQIPGKDFRSLLIDCFQFWLRIPDDKLIIIKDIIRSLHNASLLVDDIEDNSKLRRGVAVAHSIYGIGYTINSANYAYFLALEKCHSLNNEKATSIFVQELLNLHRGQGLDILWRERCSCPTEEDYKGMVIDKTGGLFRLAVGMMSAFSDCQDIDFQPLLNLLALYFQIRDDHLNVSSEEYMRSKSFCEDITEGKFSFPIIHAIRSYPDDTRLLNILRQRTEDLDVKKCAVDWLHKCGSLLYSRRVLRELVGEITEAIERLGGQKDLLRIVESLDQQLDGLDRGSHHSSNSNENDNNNDNNNNGSGNGNDSGNNNNNNNNMMMESLERCLTFNKLCTSSTSNLSPLLLPTSHTAMAYTSSSTSSSSSAALRVDFLSHQSSNNNKNRKPEIAIDIV